MVKSLDKLGIYLVSTLEGQNSKLIIEVVEFILSCWMI